MEVHVFKMPSKPNLETTKPKAKPRPRQKPKPKTQPPLVQQVPQVQQLPQSPQMPHILSVETHFILRSTSGMETAVNKLWASNRFIDIILACDGHQFPCHRLIVAAASRLIDSLLDNTTINPIVIIPFGVKAPIMKMLIDFMYTGTVLAGEAVLQELVESAKLLQITGLYDVKTQCHECFVDARGVSHVLDSKQSVMTQVSRLVERMLIQQQVDQAGYPQYTDPASKLNEDPVMVDIIEIEDTDDIDIPAVNRGTITNQAAAGIKRSPARVSSCDKGSNTTSISSSYNKYFCKYNPFKEVPKLPQNVTIRRISQPQNNPQIVDPSEKLTGKLIAMFGQPEVQSGQPSNATNAAPSNTVSWTCTSKNQTSTSTQSNSGAMFAREIKLLPAGTRVTLKKKPVLLQVPDNPFRVPYSKSPIATINQIPITISKTTPSKAPISGCRNIIPSIVVTNPAISTQVRRNTPQMPQLHPRPTRVRSISPTEMPTTSKQAKLILNKEANGAGDSVPFLKLRVPPTRTLDFSLETQEELEATINQGYAANAARLTELMSGMSHAKQEETIRLVNVAMEKDSGRHVPMEMDAVPESVNLSEEEIHYDNPLEALIRSEIDGFSFEDASFVRESFPIFYEILKQEKRDRIAAEKATENDLGEQLLFKEEAKAVVSMLSQGEIEKILCHPTLPCFDDDDDDDDLDEDEENESKVIDLEKGICIDYDRLVAETYTEDEDELQQQGKRQESDLDEKPSFCYSPEIIPFSLPKYRKRKYPPTLVPLSVMHAKQFYYNHKLNTEENGDINFKEDPSIFGDADLLPVLREGDPHSPNAVILRNPRCNQPRNYSTESLYNALMAVKYGESIYRASRLHDVPRKTLRNWMKRFNIKSKHPMPKQLQDAANNNRKKDSMLLSRASIAVAKSNRITRNSTKRTARTCTVTSSTATLSISEDSGFKGFPDGDYTYDN